VAVADLVSYSRLARAVRAWQRSARYFAEWAVMHEMACNVHLMWACVWLLRRWRYKTLARLEAARVVVTLEERSTPRRGVRFEEVPFEEVPYSSSWRHSR
jgi:hypothetical protein